MAWATESRAFLPVQLLQTGDLQREGVGERDLLQPLEAARGAGVAGLHIGAEQEERVAGLRARAASPPISPAPNRSRAGR